MKTYLIVPALVLSLAAAAAPATAEDDASTGTRLNVPHAQWLSPAQISDKLTAQGYKVTEIETDDGAYEVELSTNGAKIEARVHPATAELLVGSDD
jgi:hypothetical protein